jgi:hypothetical protein
LPTVTFANKLSTLINHAYDSLKFCIICEVFCMVPQVLLRGSAYFKLYLRN